MSPLELLKPKNPNVLQNLVLIVGVIIGFSICELIQFLWVISNG